MNDNWKFEKGRGGAPSFAKADVPETLWIQIEALLQEQGDLLDETLKMLAAWTKRRHEASGSAFLTFEESCGCKNVGAATAAYGAWLTGSMDQLMADMIEVRDQALRLADLTRSPMVALSPTRGDAKRPRRNVAVVVDREQPRYRTRFAKAGKTARGDQ